MGCQLAWLGKDRGGGVFVSPISGSGQQSLELMGTLVEVVCASPCCVSGPVPSSPEPLRPTSISSAHAHLQPSPGQALGLIQHMLAAPETLECQDGGSVS